MLWELFGSDAKVAAALAQSKSYDISPKSVTKMPVAARSVEADKPTLRKDEVYS